MLPSRPLKVLATLVGQDRIGAPLVLLSTGSFDEARRLESIDQPASSAVGQDALCCKGLDSKTTVVFDKEPEEHFVLGVAEACGASEIFFELLRQPCVG